MNSAHKARVEDADDDVDDLDDVLDQFTPARPAAPAAPPPSAAPKFGPAPPPADEDDDPLMGLSEEQFGDEFAQELAKSMERLMSDLAAESGLDASGADLGRATGPDGERTAADEERDRKLQAAWEAMLIEGMNGQMDMGSMGGRAVSEKKAGPALPSKDVASGPSSDSFQDSIRKAMDKLKQSESSHQTSDKSDKPGETDSLEALLAKLQATEDPEKIDEGLQGMLETMMGSLMSKTVLQEPLQELHDKFPAYLKDHATEISVEDKARYEKQIDLISRVLVIFNASDYSDEDPAKRAQIVDIMSELQEHGSPPKEIMGDLPPGMDFGPDGMPQLPEGCTIA